MEQKRRIQIRSIQSDSLWPYEIRDSKNQLIDRPQNLISLINYIRTHHPDSDIEYLDDKAESNIRPLIDK